MRSLLRVLFLAVLASALPCIAVASGGGSSATLFPIQSIDTMKDSRDGARAAEANPGYAQLIAREMALIRSSGANYVAIDTPYDPEFLPVLTEWVAAARESGLSIWFRGNLSGWEGWFGYGSLSESAHTAGVVAFIHDNPSLFADGDIFSPCPECENGAAGDPRATGDVAGYRRFLIGEYDAASAAFAAQGKRVRVLNSSNYDVAKLVMDPATTRALGGMVAIDDYVASPAVLAAHIASIASSSQGSVILGEFGAPIPDINGAMGEGEQAAFVRSLLDVVYRAHVSGANYWDLRNGSTALADAGLAPYQALSSLAAYYQAARVTGTVRNDIGFPLSGIAFEVGGHGIATSTDSGSYALFVPQGYAALVAADPRGQYATATIAVARAGSSTPITLMPLHPSLWYQALERAHAVFVQIMRLLHALGRWISG